MFTAFIVLFRSLMATNAIVMIAVVPIRMSFQHFLNYRRFSIFSLFCYISENENALDVDASKQDLT